MEELLGEGKEKLNEVTTVLQLVAFKQTVPTGSLKGCPPFQQATAPSDEMAWEGLSEEVADELSSK